MHKEGPFWQNRAYPAGRWTLRALEAALHPYSAHVAGSEHIRIGCVSRYLGILAAALPGSTKQSSFRKQW